jgi:hypothetical protein
MIAQRGRIGTGVWWGHRDRGRLLAVGSNGVLAVETICRAGQYVQEVVDFYAFPSHPQMGGRRGSGRAV